VALVAVTVAPGITWSCASVTRPDTEAVPDCAHTVPAVITSAATTDARIRVVKSLTHHLLGPYRSARTPRTTRHAALQTQQQWALIIRARREVKG
jgi:hypothetical protein